MSWTTCLLSCAAFYFSGLTRSFSAVKRVMFFWWGFGELVGPEFTEKKGGIYHEITKNPNVSSVICLLSQFYLWLICLFGSLTALHKDHGTDLWIRSFDFGHCKKNQAYLGGWYNSSEGDCWAFAEVCALQKAIFFFTFYKVCVFESFSWT